MALSALGVMDLGLPEDQSAQDMVHALRTISADACHPELFMFRGEVDAVMLEQAEEEAAAVVHAGVTAAGDVNDDVGLRESTVDSLAAVAERLGCRGTVPEATLVDSAAVPASGSAEPRDPVQGALSAASA